MFLVALLVQGSAFAAIPKKKGCEASHAKQTEFQLLKDKLTHDPHADIEAIINRMEVVAGEYKDLESKCKR